MDLNRQNTKTSSSAIPHVIDEGLRAHMLKVYNYMASGVLLTGVVSLLLFQLSGGNSIQVTSTGITGLTGIKSLTLSSTSLLIMVGVALDTMRQLESQLLMRNYQGFMD